MKNPIILPKKQLCIDAEDIFAIWYPYLVHVDLAKGREEQYQLVLWIVKNGIKGECSCLYDTIEGALVDYNFLIEVVKKYNYDTRRRNN